MEQNKEKNFISAVVYCCNDAKHIGSFLQTLYKTLEENFCYYEIIVVNDASTDDSQEVIRKLAHSLNEDGHEHTVTLVNMSFRQGLEASMNAGQKLAIGDFVFEFDTAIDDFQWSVLMDIYRHSLTGYDVVSAKSEKSSRISSRLFYYIFNKYAHLQHDISTESFRILSRRAINRVQSTVRNVPYRKAAYSNCGLPVAQLSYKPTKKHKHKNYSDRRFVAVEALLLFTDVPFHATMTLAALMLTVSVSVGIYALIYKIMRTPVEGWTATTLFQSFAFCGLFLILSMIIRYLQMLLRMNFRKKSFVFESIEKLQ